MHFIVNLTTKEYIAYEDLNSRDKQLFKLLKKLDDKTAINHSEIGYSRWNRVDNIVIAPEEINKYVEDFYSLVKI